MYIKTILRKHPEISIICWKKGARTPHHSHLTYCRFRVLYGEIQHTHLESMGHRHQTLRFGQEVKLEPYKIHSMLARTDATTLHWYGDSNK